MVKYTLA